MIKLEVCIESGVAVGRRKSIKWKSHMKWGFKSINARSCFSVDCHCSVIIMGTLQFQETRKDPTEIAHPTILFKILYLLLKKPINYTKFCQVLV